MLIRDHKHMVLNGERKFAGLIEQHFQSFSQRDSVDINTDSLSGWQTLR